MSWTILKTVRIAAGGMSTKKGGRYGQVRFMAYATNHINADCPHIQRCQIIGQHVGGKNKLTGAHTTYWDALFLDLRVFDTPKAEAIK